MRGIRRAKGITKRQESILTSLLRQMVEVLPDDLSGLRDKAILLVGFAGAFRAVKSWACRSMTFKRAIMA